MRKFSKVALSLTIVGFLGVSAVQAAGTSIAQLSPKNLNPVGSNITASSKISHAAQNYGTINFDAFAMKSVTGFDKQIAKVRIYDYDEHSASYSPGKGTYYAKAKWSGESGAAYISGYSKVTGN